MNNANFSLCPSSPAGWGRFLPLPDPGCVLWREFLPPTFAKSSLSVDDMIVWLLFDHLYLEFKYLRLLLLWSRGYSNEVELVVQLLKSLTKNRLDFTQQTPFTQSYTHRAVHTYSTHIVFFKLTHNHTHTLMEASGAIWCSESRPRIVRLAGIAGETNHQSNSWWTTHPVHLHHTADCQNTLLQQKSCIHILC